MKKITLFIVFIFLFSGCHWFANYDKKEECLEYIERYQELSREAVSIIDSLTINEMILKQKLEECQELRDLESKANN